MDEMRKTVIFLAAFFLTVAVRAEIGLSFQRTGSDASSVKVKAVDAEGHVMSGVTVRIESSHAFKTSGAAVTPAVLCPDVNGSTSPTIRLRFILEGLPSGSDFSRMGLDIHALNASGNYQQNSDGKKRFFNVAVRCGATADVLADFAALTDIDVAAGVGTSGDVHRWWSLESSAGATADGTLVVDITVTKGMQNEGCFFGLGGITLGGTGEIVPVDPVNPQPSEFPKEEASYYIKWFGDASRYMTEEADGTMVVAAADVTQRQFWQFIPTGREHCYYIRSSATGRYVQSCNLTPSSASRISTGREPVEYYIVASASGSTSGYYRLTSTDCADYDNTSASPRGLNKDGASQHIITWHAGVSNTGSYWTIEETADLYDLRPFSVSSGLGRPDFKYTLLSRAGRALERRADGSLFWADPDDSAAQSWYFVGEGNNSGGWLLADAASHRPLVGISGSDRWYVLADMESGAYFLRPFAQKDLAGTALAVEGDSLLTFRLMRGDFARASQIYDLPCGSASGLYISHARIEGPAALRPMIYPLPAVSGTSLTESPAPRPASWYTLYTACPALLVPGATAELSFTLAGGEIPTGMQVWAYFDWNRDGLFDTAVPLDVAGTMTARVEVPATAVAGRGRMRLRLTENGMSGADDEVLGQTVDFTLEVASGMPSDIRVTVRPNDSRRGTAELRGADGDAVRTAVATALGNAAFVCWREGNRVVALTSQYEVECNRSMDLTAVFSPNTHSETGIAGTPTTASTVEISGRGRRITVKAPTAVREIFVFAADGHLVARAAGNEVNVGAVPCGTYIVRAVTADAGAAVKVSVK